MNAGPFVRMLAALLFALGLARGAAAETMAYPTAADARYLLDIPAGWEAEPAEEMGGFMNISGPSGVLISLRFLPADEYTLGELMQEAVDFMQQNYTEVRLTEPKSDGAMHQNGAVAKLDGDTMVLANSWLVQPATITELRIAAAPDDGASVDEGIEILQTVRPAK
jgi:hypothetical protein